MNKKIINFVFFLMLTMTGHCLAETIYKPSLLVETTTPISINDLTDREPSYPKTTLALSLLAIIVSVGLFLRQMKIQHRDKLIQQKQQSKDELKVQIYGKLVGDITDSIELLSMSGMNFFMLANNLHQFRESYREFPKTTKWYSVDALALRLELDKALHQAIDTRIVLERYEILMPNIEIFGKAFAATIHDIRNIFLTDVLPMILEYIPLNVEMGITLPHREISDSDLEKLRNACEKLSDQISLLATYVEDLAAEAQNALLGDIFNARAKVRKPLDTQKYFVITTNPEDQERLNDYFDTQTDWGKANRTANDSVVNQLNERARSNTQS